MHVAPAAFLHTRLDHLRRVLTRTDLDGLLVTSLPNIAYLTGFFASAGAVVVHREGVLVIADGRYATALAVRVDAFPTLTSVVIDAGSSYDEAIVETLAPLAGTRIGFESAHVTVERYRSIAARLALIDGWGAGLVETTNLVETLRLRKDAWEVERLRDAATRLSDVAKCILPKALEGLTESEVAGDIDRELRRIGFDRPAFDTIVAAGPHAALPHATASGRRIEAGELVVLDFGGVLDGYCTDLTRTVVAGSPTARERRLIERVVEAQLAAFSALKPGAQPEGADQAARDALGAHDLAEAFTHGTGHGLGLEIHEGPRVTRARVGRAEPALAAGMVLTLEPGVYFPGWGGVRIEDDVLVTESGAEWLTDVKRTL